MDVLTVMINIQTERASRETDIEFKMSKMNICRRARQLLGLTRLLVGYWRAGANRTRSEAVNQNGVDKAQRIKPNRNNPVR